MSKREQAGGLNPNFGVNGCVNLLHTGKTPYLYAIASTPKSAVLALSKQIGQSGYYLSQFTAQGKLDKNFAGEGFLYANEADSGDRTNLHVLDNGSLLVAGSAGDSLVISKYLADGRLDITYGVKGHVNLPVSDLNITSPLQSTPARLKQREINEERAASPLDPLPGMTGSVRSVVDGEQVYLVFNAWWGGYDELMTVVVRFTAQGQLDKTFNGAGHVVISLAAYEVTYNFCLDMTLQVGDHGNQLLVFVLESSPPNSPSDAFLLRLTPQGTQDLNFGGSGSDKGIVRITPSMFINPARLISDASGNFKLIGLHTKNDVTPTAAVMGYNRDGQVDSAFNDGVILQRELSRGWGFWIGGQSQGDDSEYQLVLTSGLYQPTGEVYIGRVLRDGRFDDTFGTEGVQTMPFEYNGVLTLPSMAMQASGDILMGHHEYLYWLLGGNNA